MADALRDTRWVDFKAVRAAVPMEGLLAKVNVLHTLKGKGDRRQGPCPIHGSDSPDSTAFSVDLSKNLYNCFSCHAHGNVLDFAAAYLKTDLRTAALQLCDWFDLPTDKPPATPTEATPARHTQPKKPAGKPVAPQPEPTTSEGKEEGPLMNPVLTFRQGKGLLLDPEHEAVKAWGLKPDTLATFRIGYSEKSKVVGGRVAVPIHNEDGGLIAYAGRATTKAQEAEKGKWTLPPGFRKSMVLFNLHRATVHCDQQPVIVVEGFRACIVLHDRGYPNSVALMGNTISPAQVELLATRVPSGQAVVMLDGNKAGREATPAVVTALAPRLWVRSILLDNDRQPDTLTTEELQSLLGLLMQP